jgi:hypothetical protein
MLGVMGYSHFRSHAASKWWRVSIMIFWVLNIPILMVASTMYSKKSRVEAMYSIYGEVKKDDFILVEGTGSGRIYLMPKFYARSWDCHMIDRSDPTSPLLLKPDLNYSYIFFLDKKNIEQRVVAYKKIYPKMKLHQRCEASFVDDLLFKLNPRNANEYIEVWKTNH